MVERRFALGIASLRRVTVTILAFMNSFFERFDDLAGIEVEPATARWLDRAAFAFLVLMVLTCPHSIAASEIAWLAGLTITALRLAFKPRPTIKFRALDIALWTLLGWSIISSAFSYDPATSFDRLRGVSLFLVFAFAAANIRTLKAVWFLSFALVFSCMINAVKEPITRVIGRGVEIHSLNPDGPLAKSGFLDGDTLLKVNGTKLTDPAQLLTALEAGDTITVDMHRPDMYEPKTVRRAELLQGSGPGEKLGFSAWHPSHYWRATGFYRHWITYSEALQLMISLAFGLLFASFIFRKRPKDERADPEQKPVSRLVQILTSRTFLVICVASLTGALLLTATRASQLSFMISAFVIVAVAASRKFLLAAVLIVVPVAAVGLYLLQQSRQVGFIDTKDESTLYRMTMWRDGTRLWMDSPRNFIFGMGMDSKDKYWREWGMFAGGRLPLGHFHSTYVQLTVERGLPALLIWLVILGIYTRTIWRGLRANRNGDWKTNGVLLGSLGGTIGFAISGFVHSNIIDAVVTLIFYLIMGLAVRASELSAERSMDTVTGNS